MRLKIALLIVSLSIAPVVGAPRNDAATSPSLPWIRNGALTSNAAALLGEMRDAEKYALEPRDYGADALIARGKALAQAADRPAAERALDADVSRAVSLFVTHVHAGRISPREVGHDLDVPNAGIDGMEAVSRLADSRTPLATLAEYEPRLRHYRLLIAALARYRSMAAQPQPPPLPSSGRASVKPGEFYAAMRQLRQRLVQLGDLEASALTLDDDTLDAITTMALVRFQSRHRLEVDGALGRATLDALNVPVSRRVRQIEFAIERSRWLPASLDAPPIIVNIPQFELFAFQTTEDRESDLLIMKVVVGKAFPKYSTPVFAADMRQVVLSPYWDVPWSILRDEFLPQIRAKPGWTERNGFEIVRGEGDDGAIVPESPSAIAQLAAGKLRLRQKSGPDNALGRVKFMFPNEHNVYLHDTPTQGTFAQANRAASHGCVRVADPVALAHYVLRNNPEWNDERIAEGMHGQKPTRINVARPIRVFLIYATALALEDGRVLFFEDIYHHDEKLERVWEAR